MIFEGAIWLGAAAMIAYEAITAAVSATIAFFASGNVLATIGTLALKAATWLAAVAMGGYGTAAGGAAIMTTIATAGVNLLIVALGALVIAAIAAAVALTGGALFGPLLGGLVGLTRGILGVGEAFRGMASDFSGSAGVLVSNLADAAGRIGATFSDLFSSILKTGTDAFQGVMDALKTGDMTLAFEILKIAAQLAWLDIKEKGMQIWIDLKAMVVTTFYQIGDLITDIFNSVMTRVQIAWTKLMGDMKAGYKEWQETLGLAPKGAAESERALARQEVGIIARRAGMSEAEVAQAQGPATAQETPEQRDARRRARDAEIERQRVADQAAAAGDPNARDALNFELGNLNAFAAQAAELAAAARTATEDNKPGEGYKPTGGKGGDTGTVFADAMRGWLGASGGMSEAQKALAKQDIQIELLRQQIDLMRNFRGPAFA
jgi:hypothetical protein